MNPLNVIVYQVVESAIAGLLVLGLLAIWDTKVHIDGRIYGTLSMVVVLGIAYALLSGMMRPHERRRMYTRG